MNRIARRTVLTSGAGFAFMSALGPVFAQQGRKSIIAATDRAPTTTDPMLSENPAATDPLFSNIQDRITAFDRQSNPVPGVATWTIENDGHGVVFTLKKGVRFHSGDELVADDIIFSHARGMAKTSNFSHRYQTLDRIEKIDDYSVRFVYSKPDINILTNNLLYLGSKKYYDRVGEDQYTAKPVGTGPYKLGEYRVGEYYTLERFDGYWGQAPTVETVKLVVVTDESTRVARLRAGEADFIHATPYHEVANLKQSGFNIVTAKTFPTVALTFQNYNPKVPWFRRDVRLALAMAIDRNAIVNGLFRGIPELTAMFSPGELGYDPDLKMYPYDPAKAKDLLSKAGYPRGFDMPISVATSAYGLKETTEAVVAYLQQIGVRAQSRIVDSTTLGAQRRNRGRDPEFVFSLMRALPLANYGDPASAMYQSMAPSAPTATYKPESPEVESLMELSVTQLDQTLRANTVKRIAKLFHDEVAFIPLWNSTQAYAMKPDLNFVPIEHNKPLFMFADVTVKK